MSLGNIKMVPYSVFFQIFRYWKWHIAEFQFLYFQQLKQIFQHKNSITLHYCMQALKLKSNLIIFFLIPLPCYLLILSKKIQLPQLIGKTNMKNFLLRMSKSCFSMVIKKTLKVCLETNNQHSIPYIMYVCSFDENLNLIRQRRGLVYSRAECVIYMQGRTT